MKTLYLVRHGKSAWSDPDLSDVERPLLEKGKMRTRRINEYLIKSEIIPDVLICSHAVRAQKTAEIIAHAVNYPREDILIDKSLYYGNADTIRTLFFDLPSDAKSMMIIGHNPTLTNFANLFMDNKIDWLPTSAVVALKFNADNWLNVLNTKPEILFYIYPSLLKEK